MSDSQPPASNTTISFHNQGVERAIEANKVAP
jgi:hypothetical protein